MSTKRKHTHKWFPATTIRIFNAKDAGLIRGSKPVKFLYADESEKKQVDKFAHIPEPLRQSIREQEAKWKELNHPKDCTCWFCWECKLLFGDG